MRSIPESYLQAKQDLEASLLKDRDGNGGNTNEAFDEARQDFSECINRWQQKNGERQDLLETLDEKRRNYEQRANDFEFDRALLVLGRGEHAALVGEYGKVYQAFEEAEARCEEIRQPYEQAIQDAQRNYETKRQEYLRVVEEIREQLDKAPDEYLHRFEEVLSGYNRVCAEEREQVISAGGLHILGTERHESRRIDNQLRGRAGRQGDPGLLFILGRRFDAYFRR